MASELNDEQSIALEEAREVLQTFKPRRHFLIPILQALQRIITFLPTQAIEMVADHLQMSPTEVFGVATFYNQFRFNPPGRHPVRVCLGTACHVKGGDFILEHFERKLDIREGETTPDLEFSIDRVACVGCCSLAPVTLVGDTLHGHMMTTKVDGLILRTQIEKEKAERERRRHERQ